MAKRPCLYKFLDITFPARAKERLKTLKINLYLWRVEDHGGMRR
jgi:hypothetical protein